MNYKGPGKVVAVMERAMRLSEEVVRYLTVKQEVADEAALVAEAEA
jgi:small subunit ribosomal protein S6